MIQGLTTNDSSDFSLLGSNHPSWLAYTGEGPSARFQVPEDIDCHVKGINLCVVYSSTSENIGAECLTSVLIINYTKCTVQIYKRDTVMSFNDEDWKNVASNLGPGDDMEIFVAFGHGLIVKETIVYLFYDQSITTEFEQSIIMEVGPSTNMEIKPLEEVNAQPSPIGDVQPSSNVEVEASITMEIEKSIIMEVEPSTNMEMKPLEEVNVQPSSNVKVEASITMEIEQSISMEVESSANMEMEPLVEVNVQSSANVKVEASSTNVETDPSPEVKVQSSPIMEMKPLPKLNKSIFTKLGKRMGACFYA
jgi:hypothetical protein